MKEQTLIIAKPDAMAQGVEFEIFDAFCKEGFQIRWLYRTWADEPILREHYADPIKKYGEEIGGYIIKEMKSGPIAVAVLERENAVAYARHMTGDTDPAKSEPGTLRKRYSTDSLPLSIEEKRCVKNAVHASDSKEAAEREIALWFDTSRIHDALLFSYVAETVGYNRALGPLFEGLVNESNLQRVLYHGIKQAEYARQIEKEGVKPLTPEVNGSCWASGSALFSPADNSPFFNYSGNSQNGRTELNIAMLKDDSGRFGFVSNAENRIGIDVPRDAMVVIRATKRYPPSAKSHNELREYRQQAEQVMLKAIASQIDGKMIPGTTLHCAD